MSSYEIGSAETGIHEQETKHVKAKHLRFENDADF